MAQDKTPAKVATSDGLGPLYPKRDHMAQGQHYVRHVDAMTREGLHSKSRIAGELAARDIEIERLREAMREALPFCMVPAYEALMGALGPNALVIGPRQRVRCT